MATYYVSPDGSNTSPYDTWEKAAVTPKGAIDYIRTNGTGDGDTVRVSGIFTENGSYFLLNHANLDNLAIIGEGADLTRVSATAADGTDTLSFSGASDVVVTGIAFGARGLKRAIYNSVGVNTVADSIAYSEVTHIGTLVQVVGGTLHKARNLLRYIRTDNSHYSLYFSSTGGGSVDSCVSEAAPSSKYSEGWTFAGGDVTVTNSAILDCCDEGVFVTAGDVSVSNTVVAGGYGNSSAYAVRRSGGTLTINNSIIVANPWDANVKWVTGTVTESNNIKTNPLPGWVRYARGGYILPHVDDTAAYAYAQQVEVKMAEHGVHGTYFPELSTWESGNDADLRRMVADGTIGIAPHSYSHSNLSYTHALNISQVGGDNPTVSLVGSILSLECDGDSYDQTIDLADEEYNTVAKIISALNGVKGWTVLKSTTDGQDEGLIYDATLATSLLQQDVTAAPCDVDFDVSGYDSGYYRDEILSPKSALESIINGMGDVVDPATGTVFEASVFGFPYNTASSSARQAVIDAGYLGGRCQEIGGSGSVSEMAGLTSLDLYSIPTANASTYLKGADETSVRQSARAIGVAAAQAGIVMSFITHSTSQLSIEELGWCLEEWAQVPGLTVTSFQRFLADIRESWTDMGSGIWSKPVSDGDYSLRSTSPCIGTGTVVTGIHDQATPATDINGDPVVFTPNIGAYDGRTQQTLVANFSPTGYAVRTGAILNVGAQNLTIDLTGLTNNEAITVQARGKTFTPLLQSNHTVTADSGGGVGRSFGMS